MTVSTTNITSGPYTGNGVTTAFSYTFRVEDKTQLSVYETDTAGIETLLTVDTDYTVGSIGNDAGGLVTRVAGALPSGYTWYIRSAYAETQLTAFASQGAFFPAVHESAFDKLTFLLQQIRDSSSRALSLSDSYSGAASTVMPTPAALKFLRWDATGLALESVSGTEGLGIASDVSFTPAGSISSTNVQSAIEELDTSAAKVDEDLVYTGASFKILADTADGSDNKWVQIAGGGAGTTSRGAVLTLDGDETSGDFFLESGDSGDGNVTTGGTLTLTGTTAVNISSSGTLALTATTAVTVPTASPGTNSTVAASTAYADAAAAAVATTKFTSAAQTITSGGLLTLPHGLGAKPFGVSLYGKCLTAEDNWVIGDEVELGMNAGSAGTTKLNTVYTDATNIYLRFTNDTSCFSIGNKDTGVLAPLVNANWELYVRAWV